MGPPPAHVLQTTAVPGIWQWLAVGLLGLGGTAILSRRGLLLEAAGWAVFGLAFAGLAAIVGVTTLTPTAPGYTLSLAGPAPGPAAGSPVHVTVCGRARDGTAVTPPDPGNVLAVLVDGVEVEAMRAPRFDVVVPAGRHQLAVELLTADHHAFTPAVATAVDLSVAAGAAPAPAAACPPGG